MFEYSCFSEETMVPGTAERRSAGGAPYPAEFLRNRFLPSESTLPLRCAPTW
jgi:hypothetical protein